MARPRLLPLAKIERGERGGAHADQRTNSVKHGADGIGKHQSGQAILPQNMADKDAIDGDIDAGDQHGGHGRGDIAPKEAGKRGGAQIDCGHKMLNGGKNGQNNSQIGPGSPVICVTNH